MSSPLNRRRALILVSNGCSAHTVGVSVGVLFMVICVRVFLSFYLQTIHRSSCYALSLSFSSNKIFFCFRFLTLFFSHLFLFASSPKKNRKNCLTNTLVVLLMLFSLSLFLCPFFLLPLTIYLGFFFTIHRFSFLFLQSTVHKSGDFCFCLLQLDVK